MNTMFIIGGVMIFLIIISAYIMNNKKEEEKKKKEEEEKKAKALAAGGSTTTPTTTPTTLIPVNCVLSDWSVCDKPCSGGKRIRTITTPAAGNGTACGALEETCNTQACVQKVDCVMSDWAPQWSNCTADCDGGKQYKSRRIITQPSGGGQACGEQQMEQACNTQACIFTPEKLNLSANTKYSLAIDGDNNTFYTPASDKEEITFVLPKPKRITKIKLRFKLDPIGSKSISYNIFFVYNGQKGIAVGANTSNTINKTGFVETSHNIINSNLIEKVIIEFTPLTDLYEVEIEGRDKN